MGGGRGKVFLARLQLLPVIIERHKSGLRFILSDFQPVRVSKYFEHKNMFI